MCEKDIALKKKTHLTAYLVTEEVEFENCKHRWQKTLGT